MRRLFRRLGFYLLALWASITLNFFIPRLAPGNPAQALIARFHGRLPPQAQHALEIALGVSTHESLWDQYVQYLNNLLHGNLGLSIVYFPTPVVTLLAQEMPWTLALSIVSLVLSFALGTLMGVLVAWHHGALLDTVVTPAMTLISALPYFWLALIALYFLGFLLKWFPISGGYNLSTTPGWNADFLVSTVQHALLPILTIVLSSLASWLLGMRNAMITTLTEDYVLLAEAKGLSERRVMLAYAARNAVLPNITGFAISFGFVVSGQLLTEIVFNYPGIGFALLNAVQNADYALLQGIYLILTVAVLAANLLADLAILILDPRVRE